MITAKQIRMAKAALGLSNKEISTMTGLHAITINRAENGLGKAGNLLLIKATLEAQGIEFIGTTGINLREPKHE
jgi:hypothetical protein